MTEAELQEHVRKLCTDLGLYHYHTFDSRRSQRGFPDSVIINRHTGRIIFRELKTDRGQLTPEQKQVRYMLAAGGHDWAVWRPIDLHDQTIQRELIALAQGRITRGTVTKQAG